MKRKWSISGYDQITSLVKRNKSLEEVRKMLTEEVLRLREELKTAKEERHKFDATVSLFARDNYLLSQEKSRIAYYNSMEVPINSDYIASELRRHLKRHHLIEIETTIHLHDKGDCRTNYIISSDEPVVERMVYDMFTHLGSEVARKVIIW